MLDSNKVLILFIFFFIILGCQRENKIKNEPKISMIKEFPKLQKEKILYQFYQKFGFTDVCAHERYLISVDKNKVNFSEWKKLPFTQNDLKLINNLSNKLDPISCCTLDIGYDKRHTFQDIEIEFFEYSKKDSISTLVDILKGFYKLDSFQISIFNENNNLYYAEKHYCN